MALVDLILLSLCVNNTCVNDTPFNYSWLGDAQISEPLDNTVSSNLRKKLEEESARLRNQTIKVTTLQNYPLNYLVNEDNKLVGKGVAFLLLEYISEKYEFNYSIIPPKEDILGDNTTGVFGMISQGEVDLAAAFLPVMIDGQPLVDYSMNLDSGDWVVLMKRPKESANGAGLLAPFTLDVWLLILISLVAVGPIIYFMIYIHARLCPMDDLKVFSMLSCVWFVYGGLMKQGTPTAPVTHSSRLLFATWWIFITILTAFYTANLTAFLTLSKFTLPIQSPEDMNNKRYHWITRKGNAIQEAVENKNETLSYFYSYPDSFSDEMNEVILEDWVNKKNYMFLAEKLIVDHLMYADYKNKTKLGVEESERCTYVITEWTILVRPRAFAYSKKFPYKTLFDWTLRSFVEMGVVKHLVNEKLPGTKICPLDLKNKERRLRNSDLFTTYLVILTGFAVSATMFITEIFVNIFHRYRKKNQFSNHFNNKNENNNNNYYNNFGNKNPKRTVLVRGFGEPPPAYKELFLRTPDDGRKRKIINGRQYWIVQENNGQTRLVPIHTPSALLFQYTN